MLLTRRSRLCGTRFGGLEDVGSTLQHQGWLCSQMEKLKTKKYFPRSGQKLFILHMLVLPLIPITALVIQNSVNMSTLQGYQTRVSTIRRQVVACCEFKTTQTILNQKISQIDQISEMQPIPNKDSRQT